MSGQLELPLDYAPQELRDHGYRDAHTFPLVSPDVGEGAAQLPATGIGRVDVPVWLELPAGNTCPCITMDCAGAISVGHLSEFHP